VFDGPRNISFAHRKLFNRIEIHDSRPFQELLEKHPCLSMPSLLLKQTAEVKQVDWDRKDGAGLCRRIVSHLTEVGLIAIPGGLSVSVTGSRPVQESLGTAHHAG